ncbi:MAG: DUF4870 domain-containing protein [Nonlabens sp.]
METTNPKHYQYVAAGIHLATFGKWIFPLGNFIFPIIVWIVNGKKSGFVDRHGREAINFQISLTLYTIILAFIGGGIIIGSAISGGPVFWEAMDDGNFFPENAGTLTTIAASGLICGSLIVILAVTDLICTILAAIKASEGEEYHYPITINFLHQPIQEPTKKD